MHYKRSTTLLLRLMKPLVLLHCISMYVRHPPPQRLLPKRSTAGKKTLSASSLKKTVFLTQPLSIAARTCSTSFIHTTVV